MIKEALIGLVAGLVVVAAITGTKKVISLFKR